MSLDATEQQMQHICCCRYMTTQTTAVLQDQSDKSELNDPVEVSLNRSTLKLFKGGTATLEAEVTPFGIHPIR